jgi:hypothetical protein
MVIAAHGADGADKFGYHRTTRVATSVTFFDAVVLPPPTNEQTMELRMNWFVVPNRTTTYACQAFALPVDQVCW